MKRKVVITGLCLMLAFSITACGTKGDTAKTATADKNSTKTESAENKKVILSILVYTFFSRMFDLMLHPVVKHSIVGA